MKIVKPVKPSAQSPGNGPGAGGVSPGWVALGLSRAECLGVRESSFQEGLAQAEAVNSWAGLPGSGVDAIAVLSPDVAALFPASAANLFQDAPWHESWATVLLPWQEPPTQSIRADGTAKSFCCSSRVFSDLLKTVPVESIESQCFSLLDAILNGSVEVQRLQVRQLPLRHSQANPVGLYPNAALIMAHRGPKHFLTTALHSIMGAAGSSQVTVRVGLDLEDVCDYQDIVETFPDVEFYCVDGAPVGPYIIRQGLIDRSE